MNGKNGVRNKVILITGANRGIGRALVDSFAGRGAAKVYAAVRSLETAEPLKAAHGAKIQPVRVDLSDPASINEAARTASDTQIVVNNAGVLKTSTPLDDGVFEALDYEMDINVHGLIRMAKAFAPVLGANGGGAFVQLNSVASLKNFAAFATYCASKAAAYSITQALRELLAPSGIQVVSVHPGPIATDMAENAGLSGIAEPAGLVADAIAEALETGAFHVFPDSMAKQIGGAYRGFAESIVEANLMEA